MRRVVAAVVLAFATVAPASADILSQPKLVAIVRSTPQLRLSTIGGRTYVGFRTGGDGVGYLDSTILDYGQQADRQDVLIVPLVSGGSGGVFTTIIFTHVKTKASYAGRIDSEGHLDVHLSAGVITAVVPVYDPHDPQSSPSHHKTTRYRLRGTMLTKLDEFPGPRSK